MPKLTANENALLTTILGNSLREYEIKKFFFEACLFMDGQDGKIKKSIAHYYAQLLNARIRRLYFSSHRYLSFKQFDTPKNKNLILFLEASILQVKQQYSLEFKNLLINFEKIADSAIYWVYGQAQKVRPYFPKDFNYRTLIENYHALEQQAKLVAHQRTAITFSWPAVFQ